MGTPEFAVASLQAIDESEHEVAAVVTSTDKPAGRGLQMHFSEVKKYALAHNLPLLQPEKLRDEDFIQELKKINADLFVVVAFRMLPKEVYTLPPKGTFNVHASLLPNYRGAAPIHHAIINGETKTGVTTFFLNHEIDKGNIIASEEVNIGSEETTGELYERLMHLGAELALKTINSIANGTACSTPQKEIETLNIKPAPKIDRETLHLDWDQPAQIIFNKIRGLSPYPGAFSTIQKTNGEICTIKWFSASISELKSCSTPGKIIIENKRFLYITTKSQMISIKTLQIQGKIKMNTEQFLQGFHIENYINQLI